MPADGKWVFSVEELAKFLRQSKNGKEQKRLMTINMLWQGLSVSKVAACLLVSDVSVYNWVLRFNSKGLEGLISYQRGGRPRLVNADVI